MKISSLIAAVLFAGAATTGAVYADDKAAAPKAAEAQADKAADKPAFSSPGEDWYPAKHAGCEGR